VTEAKLSLCAGKFGKEHFQHQAGHNVVTLGSRLSKYPVADRDPNILGYDKGQPLYHIRCSIIENRLIAHCSPNSDILFEHRLAR
jgi:hypothetical protein